MSHLYLLLKSIAIVIPKNLQNAPAHVLTQLRHCATALKNGNKLDGGK